MFLTGARWQITSQHRHETGEEMYPFNGWLMCILHSRRVGDGMFSIAAVESAQTWRLEDNLSSYSPAHQRTNTGLPGPRSTCQQGAFASGGSRGRPISLPFPAVECTPFLGSRPIPPSAQPATATCVLLTPPSLRFPLAPPSSPFKDPSGPGPPR